MVKALRESGWSTKDIAARIGVTPSRVSQIAGVPKVKIGCEYFEAKEVKAMVTPGQYEFLRSRKEPMSVYIRKLVAREMQG